MKITYLIGGILYLASITTLHANTGDSVELMPVKIDLADKEGLQRGAKLFMNYCSGCHSLRYMRYNRMAMDLGLTTFDGQLDDELLQNNLIFTHATVHDPITISMPPGDARQWFGVVPPDLSLVARKRGEKWLYTYLNSFYEDKSRPFGTNNLLIPNVAMPDVLSPLVGRVIPVRSSREGSNPPIEYLMNMGGGEMTKQEFANAMQELVSFLVYIGEPVKLVRYRAGGFVIAYLCVFLLIGYRLKKNYWKGLPP